MLAGAYIRTGYPGDARQLLEQLLKLESHRKDRDTATMMVRFNLAQLYFTTGFPAVAYELSLTLDGFELFQQSGQSAVIDRSQEFQHECRETVEELAAANCLTLEDYLPFASELDRGRLALDRQPADLAAAKIAFQKAVQINPTSPVAFNNLALTFQAEGDGEGTLTSYRHVLQALDNTSLPALSGIIRVLVSLGRNDETIPYLRQLEQLYPVNVTGNDDPTRVLKMAEAYVALENDRKVFDLLDPLVGDTLDEAYQPRQNLVQTDPGNYSKVLTMLLVAAANLGNNDRALELYEELETETGPAERLVEREQEALLDSELGPRPGGRFFYWDPLTMYPGPVRSFQQMVTQYSQELKSRVGPAQPGRDKVMGMQNDKNKLLEIMRPFFEQDSRAALDYLTFTYWITINPAHLSPMAAQTLAAQNTGAVELMRRFAFERVGNSQQRMVAALALMQQGLIASDEPVTIWIGVFPRTGTVEELSSRLEKAEAEYNQRLEQSRARWRDKPKSDTEAGSLVEEALKSHQAGDYKASIAAYRRLVEKYPLDQSYRHILASRLGEEESTPANREETILILQDLLRQDPGFNTARTTLARIFIYQGQLLEAQKELELVEQTLSGFDLEEVVGYYYACILLHEEKEQYTQALETSRRILTIEPENEFALDMVDRYERLAGAGGMAGVIEEHREKARQQRWQHWGQLIRPDTGIKELVELFNKDELGAILSGWKQPFDKRKGHKADYLNQVRQILSPQYLEQIRNSGSGLGEEIIDKEAQQALWHLLKLGGYSSYTAWQAASGFEDGLRQEQYLRLSRLYLWGKLPGRLQALGLVYLGEVEGQGLMALVPADIREELSRLLEINKDKAERVNFL